MDKAKILEAEEKQSLLYWGWDLANQKSAEDFVNALVWQVNL